MHTLDLNRIIPENNLEVKKVAEELFPKNKYPKLALDRVLKGEAFLDTNQLSLLSLMTGVPIHFLYSNGSWEMSTKKKGMITFQTQDYKAELDLENWVTKIYHKNSLFHEALLHKEAIPLSEYLEQINNLIIKNN
jgi:hypothetical protein